MNVRLGIHDSHGSGCNMLREVYHHYKKESLKVQNWTRRRTRPWVQVRRFLLFRIYITRNIVAIHHQSKKIPPSIIIVWPVMKRASGVTRNETRFAISWVVPRSPTADNRLNSS